MGTIQASNQDALSAADLEYFQFVATLDARTCKRCGSHDGQITPLADLEQGDNAPPLHPRCRCTIIASLGERIKGKRITEGRSKIDARITYDEWKAGLVIPKTQSAKTDGFVFDLQRFAPLSLPEGNYNLTLRRQVQNRHIEGTREYQEYANRLSEKNIMPSKMPPSTDCQALVKEFHGKGIYDPNPRDNSPRERVDTGRIIGQYWDTDKNQFVDTTQIKIVYSKKGAHIYPIRPEEE